MTVRLGIALLALAALVCAQAADAASEGAALPTGWRLRPGGTQVAAGEWPLKASLSPNGRFVAVSRSGVEEPSVSLLRASDFKETGRAPVADAWPGLVFSPDGRHLYASGGGQAAVYEFKVSDDGRLSLARVFEVVPQAKRTARDFAGDIAFSPDGRLLYVAAMFQDAVMVINPQSGRVIERFATGRRPSRVVFHPDGKSFFVTGWADGSLHHHETVNGRRISSLRLGPQPVDLALGVKPLLSEEGEPLPYRLRLFAAAANTNRVYVAGVTAGHEMALIDTIDVSMTRRQPLGMTPSALALDEAAGRLHVVCSDANAVAVVDVTGLRSRVLGFLPVGWYPTAASVLPGGGLAVVNARGSAPSVGAGRRGAKAGLPPGSISLFDKLGEEELAGFTRTVLENSPYDDGLLDAAKGPASSLIPLSPGAPSPLKHVLYIIRGRFRLDRAGGAEAGAAGANPGPNLLKLAREYTVLSGMRMLGDSELDGMSLATAAIVPHMVQRLWPGRFAGRHQAGDLEGGEPAALPAAGYLWSNAAAAGLRVRSYGIFVRNSSGAAAAMQVEAVPEASLARFTDRKFRGPDHAYPDSRRAEAFAEDLRNLEASGQLPDLMVMRLAGGTAEDMADHDRALGAVVAACARSPMWPRLSIFIVDAGAPDGIKGGSLVVSPYARRGHIDPAPYSTASVLRTIELILGLRPMTHYDAAAPVIHEAFQAKPEARPFEPEWGAGRVARSAGLPTAGTATSGSRP